MKLKEIAHIRTGDKGNTCNICVIAYDAQHFDVLRARVTAELVKDFYAQFCCGDVRRYVVESVCGLNFVLEDSLDGGVTRSLGIDRHGKSLGMALLELEI